MTTSESSQNEQGGIPVQGDPPAHKGAQRGFRFYLVAGLLTLIPLWVTYLVVRFVFTMLSSMGAPWVAALFTLLKTLLPDLPAWVTPDWLQSVIAVLVTVAGLYLLGRIASHVIGSRVITTIDNLMSKIPFAKIIYGNTKKLLSVLQRSPGEKFERVAFIHFPTQGMKAIGFVTSEIEDERTGEKLVSVFVPTTPNPTSGYLEVIPMKNVVMTNWGIDEAMQYIMSGGAGFPDKIPFSESPADQQAKK